MIVDRAEVLSVLGLNSTAITQQLGIINLIHPLVERAVKGVLRSSVEVATYTHFLPKRETVVPRDALLDAPYDIQGNRAIQVYGRFVSGDRLALPQTPVRSVTSVFIDLVAWNNQATGAYPADGQITQGVHFYVDWPESISATQGLSYTGELVRICSAWPQIPGCVKVTYTAGYYRSELDGNTSDANFQVDVSDIKLATLMAIASNYNMWLNAQQGYSGPITRERLGNYSVQVGQSGNSVLANPTDGFNVIIPPAAREMLLKYVNLQALIGN